MAGVKHITVICLPNESITIEILCAIQYKANHFFKDNNNVNLLQPDLLNSHLHKNMITISL